LASSRHFDEEEGAHFLNPDIAMGKTFHVAAKQLDGTQRCYFIRVGSRIEQGSVMHAKGTNGECKASYKKELALGNYDGTIDGDTQVRQEYRKGDSEFCGSRKDADQRGVALGKEKRIGRNIKRRSSLTMVKKEDQTRITAFVREPRKCVYEVVLYGPEVLLLGGGGSSGGRIGGSGRRSGSTLSKKKKKSSTRRTASSSSSSSSKKSKQREQKRNTKDQRKQPKKKQKKQQKKKKKSRKSGTRRPFGEL
jgi:hypothetical protein